MCVRKTMMTLGAAVAVMLGAGAVIAAQPAYSTLTTAEMASGQWQPIPSSRIIGRVRAIATQSPATLTVEGMIGGEAGRSVRVELTDTTRIRQGVFSIRPSDIKVGTRVWVDFELVNGKLVADSIQILDPTVPAITEPEGPDYR